MLTLVNGQRSELIDVRDRGLQYGDGCFETIRIENNSLVLLDRHLARLEKSCQRLGIELELSVVLDEMQQLLAEAGQQAVMKIIITRGAGGRGYQSTPEMSPNRILQISPYPAEYEDRSVSGVDVCVCQHRLSNNRALAGIKHLNRLDQVLASRELTPDVAEGLCLDQDDRVIEGTRSNLLLVIRGTVVSTDLTCAGVEGIMLQYLLDRFRQEGIPTQCQSFSLDTLKQVDEILICNSVFGVWPVISLTDNDTVRTWSIGPLTRQAVRYQNEVFQSSN